LHKKAQTLKSQAACSSTLQQSSIDLQQSQPNRRVSDPVRALDRNLGLTNVIANRQHSGSFNHSSDTSQPVHGQRIRGMFDQNYGNPNLSSQVKAKIY